MIVIDTNVLSELANPTPSEPVATWWRRFAPGELHLTAVSRAEVAYGLAKMPEGTRRDRVVAANRRLLDLFAARTLVFDSSAADEFGPIVAGRERIGRPIQTADAMIAAIARAHGATLATRNVKDFEDTGVALANPWEYEADE